MAVFWGPHFSKPKNVLVFCLLAMLHQGIHPTLVISPRTMLKLDARAGHYIGNVTAKCSAASAASELTLTVNLLGKVIEETLNKGKPSPKKPSFSGSLSNNTLIYTLPDPICDMSGTSFNCRSKADSGAPVTNLETLALEVSDGEVKITPTSSNQFLRAVGDKLSIRCSAILGGFDKKSNFSKVMWKWMKKDRGKLVFQDLDVPGDIENAMMQLTPCRGANFTSVLHLTLHPADNGRQYRCAYKNVNAFKFDYSNAKVLHVGQVKHFDNTMAKKKTVYSMRSLIGMLLGILSFLMVSLLGGCYIYRKFRKGKKYVIVQELLDQEEEELHKIEVRLGVAAGAGVAEESSVATEESSVVESTLASSSVAPDATSEVESKAG